MARTYRSKSPRTRRQAAADRHADELARQAGKALRDARRRLGKTQSDVARIAGISRSRYADVEVRADGGVTLAALARAADAAGGQLRLYIAGASTADQPRDAVHLRIQELIARIAQPGGWKPMPEQAFDRDARSSRAADVLLCRGREWALLEVWDWFDDVGASFREWDRRLAAVERFAISRMPPVDDEDAEPELPSVGGCWVVRGTRRNRDLVRDHSHLFRARFPGSARAWITALAGATAAATGHGPEPSRAHRPPGGQPSG